MFARLQNEADFAILSAVARGRRIRSGLIPHGEIQIKHNRYKEIKQCKEREQIMATRSRALNKVTVTMDVDVLTYAKAIVKFCTHGESASHGLVKSVEESVAEVRTTRKIMDAAKELVKANVLRRIQQHQDPCQEGVSATQKKSAKVGRPTRDADIPEYARKIVQEMRRDGYRV